MEHKRVSRSRGATPRKRRIPGNSPLYPVAVGGHISRLFSLGKDLVWRVWGERRCNRETLAISTPDSDYTSPTNSWFPEGMSEQQHYRKPTFSPQPLTRIPRHPGGINSSRREDRGLSALQETLFLEEHQHVLPFLPLHSGSSLF